MWDPRLYGKNQYCNLTLPLASQWLSPYYLVFPSLKRCVAQLETFFAGPQVHSQRLWSLSDIMFTINVISGQRERTKSHT